MGTSEGKFLKSLAGAVEGYNDKYGCNYCIRDITSFESWNTPERFNGKWYPDIYIMRLTFMDGGECEVTYYYKPEDKA